MNDIKIAEKRIRNGLRNTADHMRMIEAKIRQYAAIGDESLHKYYVECLLDNNLSIGHQLAALSWAGFKVTYTGYSKYRTKYAGDPHVVYVGFNRKEA